MKGYLERLPEEIQGLIHIVGVVASKTGMPTYLVGGFVRDLFLGVKNLDLDIVIEGDGIDFAEELAGRINAKLIRHRRFGTATLIFGQHQKIDIASARKEFYPAPAHLPVVSKGTLRDDLFRRDFTINAMAISINREDFAELLDYFGGRQDLKNKKIRILHELSFIDDPTRILRAVRFGQRYNFKIEPITLKKIREAIKMKMLERVEPHRIRDDLLLILKEKKPLKEIGYLDKLSGFTFIFPGLRVSSKIYRLMRSAEKEMRWFYKAYPKRRIIDKWLVYLMCVIDPLSVIQSNKFCRRLALRLGEEKRIVSYKKINKHFVRQLCRKDIKPSRIFILLEPLSYEVILLLRAKYANPVFRRHIEEFFEIYNGMRVFISGDDLHGLGIRPGPRYKEIFTTVLRAKLDGLVKTKEEEMILIRKIIRKNGADLKCREKIK